MRIFRATTLISALAVAACAAVALPAYAQAVQAVAETSAAAKRPVAALVAPPAGTPVPPADVPVVGAVPDGTAVATAPDATAPTGDGTATQDASAAPVAPDAPVATANLPTAAVAPATAVDAALNMATMMDGAGGGISNADLMSALESAAAAGQPMALWRLGTMYENGDGVQKDDVKAFGYFSQIANDHADSAPKGVEADIVAQSFVKMGEYYSQGLPDAGVDKDPGRAEQLLLHAATYFGNADAQYRVGELYLNSTTDPNPLQGARWLSLAAHKGHVAAQARLGDLLFNGAGIKAAPMEGLMWLSVAHDRSAGSPDEGWIDELLTRDMSVATPDERQQAAKLASEVEPSFGPPDETEPDSDE